MPVSTAYRAVQREEKKAKLVAKGREAAQQIEASGELPWRIIHGDCLGELPSLRGARLIFVDPPYNIGIDYGDGKRADLLPDDEYLFWCRSWLAACADALTKDGSLWVMICDEWVEHFALMLNELQLTRRGWIKWYETFGVNCTNNFNRCSRHILYYVADPKHFVFNAESPYIRRQSDRQTKYGDKRADPHGKLLDDVWTIPRLVDNAAERVPGFPTQVPEEILLRIVACATEPGDLVVDPFSGSATTGAAAVHLGRRYVGIERGEEFWRLSTARMLALHQLYPLHDETFRHRASPQTL
jgi:site-specific DNA-methyltransferase (adenine-specific)